MRNVICGLFCCLLFTILYVDTVNARNVGSSANSFITAVQKRDSELIIKQCYYYDIELTQIKKNNPKSLWPNVTKQYYANKVAAMKDNSFWNNYSQNMMNDASLALGSFPDPVMSIKKMAQLITPSSKWKISETRREKIKSNWDGKMYTMIKYYVDVHYDLTNPMKIGTQYLKSTIVQLTFEATSNKFISFEHMQQGNVYYENSEIFTPVTFQKIDIGSDQHIPPVLIKTELPKTQISKNNTAIIFKKDGKLWNRSLKSNKTSLIVDSKVELFSVSENGVVIYKISGDSALYGLSLKNMKSSKVMDSPNIWSFSISPDGKKLAVTVQESEQIFTKDGEELHGRTSSVNIYDLDSGSLIISTYRLNSTEPYWFDWGTWSDDSVYYCFTRNLYIPNIDTSYIINSNTKDIQYIGVQGPVYEFKYDQIRFSDRTTGVSWIVDVKHKSLKSLAQSSLEFSKSHGDFYPFIYDKHHIIYISNYNILKMMNSSSKIESVLNDKMPRNIFIGTIDHASQFITFTIQTAVSSDLYISDMKGRNFAKIVDGIEEVHAITHCVEK